MARRVAWIKCEIWHNPDWTGLTSQAQRLYTLILGQPDLNHCGLISLRPRRWAGLAADTTTETILEALTELEHAEFVVVDYDTEEVWVRTFVEHDGVLTQPNVARCALRELNQFHSGELRDLFESRYGVRLREFVNGSPHPGPKGNSKGYSKGDRNPSSNPSGKGLGEGEVVSSSTSVSNSIGQETATKRKTLPPEPFVITDAMRAWVTEKQITGVDVELETERMIDWAVGGGHKKLNWEAAWRNWIRTASQDASKRAKPEKSERDLFPYYNPDTGQPWEAG